MTTRPARQAAERRLVGRLEGLGYWEPQRAARVAATCAPPSWLAAAVTRSRRVTVIP